MGKKREIDQPEPEIPIEPNEEPFVEPKEPEIIPQEPKQIPFVEPNEPEIIPQEIPSENPE